MIDTAQHYKIDCLAQCMVHSREFATVKDKDWRHHSI